MNGKKKKEEGEAYIFMAKETKTPKKCSDCLGYKTNVVIGANKKRKEYCSVYAVSVSKNKANKCPAFFKR